MLHTMKKMLVVGTVSVMALNIVGCGNDDVNTQPIEDNNTATKEEQNIQDNEQAQEEIAIDQEFIDNFESTMEYVYNQNTACVITDAQYDETNGSITFQLSDYNGYIYGYGMAYGEDGEIIEVSATATDYSLYHLVGTTVSCMTGISYSEVMGHGEYETEYEGWNVYVNNIWESNTYEVHVFAY